MPIAQGSTLSGLDPGEIPGQAAQGKLKLYVRVSGFPGYVITEADCKRFVSDAGTARQFETGALRVEQAGAGATDKMAARMEDLLKIMGERQAESNAQMTAFMQHVRTMVDDGTSQSAELMRDAFTVKVSAA